MHPHRAALLLELALWLAGLVGLLSMVLGLGLILLPRSVGLGGRWAGLSALDPVLLALGPVVALAGFLVVTGITLLRREGFALSRLLGFGLGVGMLGYIGLWVAVVATASSQWAAGLLLLGLPLGYLGRAE